MVRCEKGCRDATNINKGNKMGTEIPSSRGRGRKKNKIWGAQHFRKMVRGGYHEISGKSGENNFSAVP